MQNPDSIEDVREGIHGLDIPEKEKTSPLSNSLLGSDESLSTILSGVQSQEFPLINIHQVEPNPDVEDGIERYISSGRPTNLIREERRETGRTNFNVYKGYLRAASAWPWVYWSVVTSLLIG